MPQRTGWQRRVAGSAGLVAALTMLPVGCPTAVAQDVARVNREVVAERRKDQIDPQVDGSWVVWKDYRSVSLRAVDDSPNGEIFAYNLARNEEFQVSKTKDAGQPALSGTLVVWTEGSGRTTEILGMDGAEIGELAAAGALS